MSEVGRWSGFFFGLKGLILPTLSPQKWGVDKVVSNAINDPETKKTASITKRVANIADWDFELEGTGGIGERGIVLINLSRHFRCKNLRVECVNKHRREVWQDEVRYERAKNGFRSMGIQHPQKNDKL